MSRDLLLGKFNQFSLGSRYLFPLGDIRYHDLAPCFIRDADNPGFGHRRVLVENGFHFLRRNVGAASDDEFLLAPGEPVVAFGILRDEIPAIKRSSPELCVKVRGSSSMLLLGCLGDLLRFEKREIQVATFAPDRSSP